MPQMAPYSWLLLFFIFTLIYMNMNSYFYFIKMNYQLKHFNQLNTFKFQLKW